MPTSAIAGVRPATQAQQQRLDSALAATDSFVEKPASTHVARQAEAQAGAVAATLEPSR